MPTFSFDTTITCLTGFAVSFADSRDPERKNRLVLPLLDRKPYIPSSSMRGRFRHTATRMVLDALAKADRPKLTLAEANWLAIGGVKGKNGEGDDAPSADMVVQRPICAVHPWAFFGFSEPMFMESRMQIEHATTTEWITPDVIHGQRTDPVQRGEFSPEQISDPQSFDEWYGRIAQRRAAKKTNDEIRKTRQKGRRGAPQAAAATESAVEAEPERKEEHVVVPVNMPYSREIVGPGKEFHTVIDINNATDLQAGLFVATIRAFAAHPRFGAQAGMNLGLVDMTLVSGNESIIIRGRDRSCEVSERFIDLEEAFWDAFPKLDFTAPNFAKTKAE